MIIFGVDVNQVVRSVLTDTTGRILAAIDAALPAGDNNIGNVDVATLPALPAGDNNIGNVDVVTLPTFPAGTNRIGKVILVAKDATATEREVLCLADGTLVTSGGGGTGAPVDAQYVVMALNSDLTAERVLTAGDGITLTDGGAGGNATLKGVVAQVAHAQTTGVATGTTTIPLDDTIPQNTEGTEFLTVSITPKNSANLLYIDVSFNVQLNLGAGVVLAVFQDTTAAAIAGCFIFVTDASDVNRIHLIHKMTAGTTSATTFKVRVGGSAASTVTINGQGGGRRLGGVCVSSITVTETTA